MYIFIKCLHPRICWHTYPATDTYRRDHFQLFSSHFNLQRLLCVGNVQCLLQACVSTHTCISASCLRQTVCLSISQRECQDLAEFVHKVLGPYSINVTTATRLCSASLCQGKGRCVRQNPGSSAYLHLPPPAEVVEKVTEKVRCHFKQISRFSCVGFIKPCLCVVCQLSIILWTSMSLKPTPTISHKQMLTEACLILYRYKPDSVLGLAMATSSKQLCVIMQSHDSSTCGDPKSLSASQTCFIFHEFLVNQLHVVKTTAV